MSHVQRISRPNKPALVCVLTVLAFPWLAHAGTSVDEHRAASPQGAVEIDNVAGMIDVQGWDKSEVAVTGTIGKDVDRVEVTGEGNRTSIRVILPQGHHWGMRDGEAHLVIHVPANSSIAASLVSSDLKVSAVHGALELRTVSGNISGEGGGDVRANAVSGDIHLTANAAKVIEVKSISGSMDRRECRGRSNHGERRCAFDARHCIPCAVQDGIRRSFRDSRGCRGCANRGRVRERRCQAGLCERSYG
jgi:hypothetical protein